MGPSALLCPGAGAYNAVSVKTDLLTLITFMLNINIFTWIILKENQRFYLSPEICRKYTDYSGNSSSA